MRRISDQLRTLRNSQGDLVPPNPNEVSEDNIVRYGKKIRYDLYQFVLQDSSFVMVVEHV